MTESTPCVDCGRPITIYPPEDGQHRFRCGRCGRTATATQAPDWNVAIVDGQPEVVVNAAALRALMRQSPLGESEARARLLDAGVPAELLDEPETTP